jgi:catechol 2,3-dioxygenase-like lactoylglutathione lyase family enzyme
MTPEAQLTHIGLYVQDTGAMVAFYPRRLGLVVTTGGGFVGPRFRVA